VIEEFLEDSQDLVPVLEVSGEPVDVDEHVDKWYVRQDVNSSLLERSRKIVNSTEQELSLFVHLNMQLAYDDFVELFEDSILRGTLILGRPALNYFKHAIKVFLQPHLVDY
jgi:hypothetical protein